MKKYAAVLCAILASSPALAHTSQSLAGGFGAGFMHPLSGLDHMLAMFAVGLWGAFLGRPLIYLLPTVFPAMMAVGGVIGMSGIALPPVEVGIAVSVLTLGLAIAFAWRAPTWIAIVVVAVFALFHGYAHGLELPSIANPVAYSLGFVMATGLLHIAGILVGMIPQRLGGLNAIRALGGAIALVGVYFVGGALA